MSATGIAQRPASDVPRARDMIAASTLSPVLGALSALAFAPVHLPVALPLAFGGLFLLLDRTPTRRGARATRPSSRPSPATTTPRSTTPSAAPSPAAPPGKT